MGYVEPPWLNALIYAGVRIKFHSSPVTTVKISPKRVYTKTADNSICIISQNNRVRYHYRPITIIVLATGCVMSCCYLIHQFFTLFHECIMFMMCFSKQHNKYSLFNLVQIAVLYKEPLLSNFEIEDSNYNWFLINTRILNASSLNS